MDIIDGGGYSGPSDYFGGMSRKSKPKKKVKETKKPLYKVVHRQGVNDFINDVNTFIEENPDYELNDDPMSFRTDAKNVALFKLKQSTEKPKVQVKE